MNFKDFIQPDKDKGLVTVKVSAEVFPIDLVYEAAYLVMDRAYVILDGSPSETIYVLLKPRTFKGELDDLGALFYDELVSAAFHTVQKVRNRQLQEILMSTISPAPATEPSPEPEKDFSGQEDDIATLWEDKYEGSSEEG